jgi:hypothetical protein
MPDTRQTNVKGKPPLPSMPSEPDRVAAGDNQFDLKTPGHLSGYVVERVDELSTNHTDSYTMLKVDDGINPAKPVEIRGWHAKLAGLIERENPQVGDALVIRAFGLMDGRYQFAMRVEKAVS